MTVASFSLVFPDDANEVIERVRGELGLIDNQVFMGRCIDYAHLRLEQIVPGYGKGTQQVNTGEITRFEVPPEIPVFHYTPSPRQLYLVNRIARHHQVDAGTAIASTIHAFCQTYLYVQEDGDEWFRRIKAPNLEAAARKLLSTPYTV